MSWNNPGPSLVVRRCGAPLLEREHPDTRADVGRLVDSQVFLFDQATFLLKALVNLVNLLIDIRIVRFCRST